MTDTVILEVRERIGANFKKIRLRKELSLRELDALTGLDHSWISKFEKGRVNFQFDTLLRLASGLQVQLRELFNFSHPFIDE